MSLLDSGEAHREDVTVYLEEVTTDADGNIHTRPSATGIPAKARIEIQSQTGTSSRRGEQDNEGFETEQVYSLRFPRSFPHVIGAQSQIEWGETPDGDPQRWSVRGDARIYNRSRATAHKAYTIVRF